MSRTLVRAITATLGVAVIAVSVFAFGFGVEAAVCPEDMSAADCARGGLTTTAGRAGLQSERTLPEIVGSLIYAALSLTGVIFVILMVYAGILYMQARGKTEDMEKAKKIIEAAIIGIVITGLAFAITNFVLDRIIGAQEGVEYADPIVFTVEEAAGLEAN